MKNSKVMRFMIGCMMVAGIGLHAQDASALQVKNAKTENNKKAKSESTSNKDQLVVQLGQFDYSPVSLNNMKDMYKLFDRALPLIFSELVLEEVYKETPYDDKGKRKGGINTVGLGSCYMPNDISKFDDKDTEWLLIAKNRKKFKNVKLNSEEMMKLVIGWAKYRLKTQADGGRIMSAKNTVLERMFNKLNGIALRPNEFSALFCAVYNNESNIDKLLPHIKKYVKDNKIECANLIAGWCEDMAHNKGTKDRCKFEAAVFLNSENFCKRMINFQMCPKKNASSINVKTGNFKFTYNNYKSVSSNLVKKYSACIYREGKSPRELSRNLNFSNSFFIEKSECNYKNPYKEAINCYDAGKYEEALKQFLKLEKDYDGSADLLNDIATTCYQLGKYEKCIDYCKKILNLGIYEEYAKACHNAARAYRKNGDLEKALKNAEKALEYYEKYGVAEENENINYKKIYEDHRDEIKMARGKAKLVVKNVSKNKKRGSR